LTEEREEIVKPVKKIILLIFVLLTAISAQNYQISESVKRSALRINDYLINCEFDNAYKLSDSLLLKNPKEPLYYYLALASIGLKSLDFDEILDSEKFREIYERGITIVNAMLEKEPDNCDLQMIRGFLMSSNAAFLLLSRRFAAGVREGTRALDVLRTAQLCDPKNYDIGYYLGFFDYAQAELRRRLGPLAIFTSLTRNAEDGIRALEASVKNARFMNYAAKMVLVDVYVRENRLDKTAEILPALLKKYPESRFLLWTKMRYQFARRDTVSAMKTAVAASRLYLRDGAHHNAVMVLEEARKSAGVRRFPPEIREKVEEIAEKIDRERIPSSTQRTLNSLLRQ